MNNYNSIAHIYDALAEIVFWGRIKRSQRKFLNLIRAEDHVLILGGGAGSILRDLNALGIELQITYVEMSSLMVRKAKAVKTNDKLKVDFITADFLTIELSKKYNVILSNYFLDVFVQKELKIVSCKVKELLSRTGSLLVADFEISANSFWQRSLSHIMHWFFGITTNMSNKSLLNHHDSLVSCGFCLKNEFRCYKKFIVSRVYKHIVLI